MDKFDPRTHITGYARLASSDHTGHLMVKLEGMPSEANYYVLRTDYTSYAVVYNCDEVAPGVKFEGAWVLSRLPTPILDPIVDQAKFEYKKVGLDWDSEMEFTLQGSAIGCDY